MTANLDTMRLPELQALFASMTGETTRCPNRVWLIRKITDAAETAADERAAKAASVPQDANETDGAMLAGGLRNAQTIINTWLPQRPPETRSAGRRAAGVSGVLDSGRDGLGERRTLRGWTRCSRT